MQNLIADIRYFESSTTNSLNAAFGFLYTVEDNEFLSAVIRFILKLREIGFCLPDFDHIYIQLTPSLCDGDILKSDKVDPYHKFYRLIFVGVSPDFFNSLGEGKKVSFLIDRAVGVIQKYFCNSDEEKARVAQCAEIILERGEQERIIFKEKKADHCTAQIAVKVLDCDAFQACVRVLKDQAVLKEVEYPKILGRFELSFQFGSIQINKSSVKIKPKKNSLSPLYGFTDFVVPI